MAKRGQSQYGAYTMQCPVCGRSFQTKALNTVTCSNECRQRLKRWRAEDRKRTKEAVDTLNGLYNMLTRGLEADALERIVLIRDTAEKVIGRAIDAGYEIPLMMATPDDRTYDE